ncbi:NAD(P)/FAD-dependent oxidoreductase [Spongiactinospora rosea]|uniref:NAD(P)/FAD-dependent oxidoreductase n=1 Tax=Spongiactinospora rosea TaxID=2248750 RepID=A0A366LP84_9ACTN|nr:FAD-dependent oxidoreductase [Spongiactinospora rosea]RBQ14962.1 NAD(P)/FAD-dependent oxidoreductase [Spongiactinospora rosea]
MDSGTRSDVLIVGASVAGLSTARALRDEGFAGTITMVGEEDALPYDRPPLSKRILTGEWAAGESALCTQADLDRLGIRLLRGTAAAALDPAGRVVTTASGDDLRYGTLVVTTGVSARRPAYGAGLGGVHLLRTRADAIALRAGLATARRAVVAGAGVLGSEIAAGLRERGVAVTLAGRSRHLRLGLAGALLSPLIARLHRANGVELRLGEEVIGLRGDDRVTAAVLSGGDVVETDLVVAAIGCVPNTGWLASSGLDVSDGIVCDFAGRAAPGVFAAGDVAAWTDPRTGVPVRVEHQLNAAEQARLVARTIATGAVPAAPPVPFFWSDLYGTKIQVYGHGGGTSLDTIAGDPESGRFVAAVQRDGIVTAVVGWNMPRDFRTARVHVGRPAQLVDLKGR